jgi:SAM-dependent methyltransferase
VTARREHWDRVYSTNESTAVSWYQPEPIPSLRLIEQIACGPSDAVIDIGAGASRLVDRLIARDFTDVTVLDVSERALAEVRGRLGDRTQPVTFINDDVLVWQPDRTYDLWHDRAVFHFLTDRADRDQYAITAARAIRSGGSLIVATFADDGPTHCSGLPVARYSARDLDEAFTACFAPIDHEREEHTTPNGVVQPFTWATLRRI